MEFLIFALVAAATFGVCYLLDKGYTKAFRSRQQHSSGLAVRYSKRYGAFGLILLLLAVLAFLNGAANGALMVVGGIIVLLMGAGLITYYMTFGVFYDEDTFLLTTFGKKTREYRFSDITGQRLYLLQGGNVIVELHLQDQNAVSLQPTMEGVYPFLDHAFYAWCRQTGRNPEDCDFYDPQNSLWFPTEEA